MKLVSKRTNVRGGLLKKVRKKKKGFTLIELLAVVIILGILMIIAVPSVTEYISSSRKNAYVTMATQYISGARNKINSAEIPMYDLDATYYLPASCISLEKGGDSPFGKLEEAYVVITYDGFGYDYYWTSRDETNQGIYLTHESLLSSDSIQNSVMKISTDVGIGERKKIIVIDNNCSMSSVIEKSPDLNVEEESRTDEPFKDTRLISLMKGEEKIPVDNVSSKYVSSSSGINFSKSAGSTNGTGLYLMSGTETYKNPIYYYRGGVTNNNVIFGSFCWKIVRTTETGGVKLVYNGISSDGKCSNSSNTKIGEVEFNTTSESPADIGYMHGTTYRESLKWMPEWKSILTEQFMGYGSKFYTNKYGSSVVYENGVYKLQNVFTKSWPSNYKTLAGYYSCFTTNNASSCSSVYYIMRTNAGYAFMIKMSNGKMLEESMKLANTNITLGKTIVENSNGTYTLTDTVNIKRLDWYTDYANYNNYYVCPDLVSITCSTKNYITSTDQERLTYSLGTKYVYGNDVVYSNGKYTLVDTYISDMGWITDRTSIGKKYHYTCLSTSTSCSSVYYIHSTSDPSYIHYITLTKGKKINNIVDEMFSNDNDSTIKKYIDNWYEDNLLEYGQYLEDTVWCNDRSISNYGGWSKDSDANTSISFATSDRNSSPTIECVNENDRFTVDSNNGNGKLKYPIGLLTADEAYFAGNGFYQVSSYSSFLSNGGNWWLMSPSSCNTYSNYVLRLYPRAGSSDVDTKRNVLPAISLVPDIKVEKGTGTISDPYIIKMN